MPSKPQSRIEFIALMAMMVATVAFSVDSMLPALPEIAQDLTPDRLNHAQLIITAFAMGMGIGTLFTGPLSDTFGRKPVIVATAALYIIGAALSYLAPTIELMIAARVLQGLGAAGPRTISMAVIRDLYSGREMARLMSFVMMVFTMIPAVAPLIGLGIMSITGWRGIFLAFILFSVISTLWMSLRLDEPLPKDRRRSLDLRRLATASREMLSIPMVRQSIFVQTMCFGMLFTSITMIQQIFDQTFDKSASFTFWFFSMALCGACANMLNAALVVRIGMWRIATGMLALLILASLLMLGFYATGPALGALFIGYLLWQAMVFFQMGMTLGNLNAMAMGPLGHIAGLASSIIGALSTVGGAVIGSVVGQMFDGTPQPLISACAVMSAAAFATMLRMNNLEARAA